MRPARDAAAPRLVDRNPLRDRLALLPGRPVSGFHRAGRLASRRNRLLRRLGLFHPSAAFLQFRAVARETIGWRRLIELIGTLFFNVDTFRAMQTSIDTSQVDRLIWAPDAVGSACFLISGVLAYPRAALRWGPRTEGVADRGGSTSWAACSSGSRRLHPFVRAEDRRRPRAGRVERGDLARRALLPDRCGHAPAALREARPRDRGDWI